MRAQVVIFDGECILVARHACPDREYWVLPGGAIEPGETPEEAAVRETLEETGLTVRLQRLLFVDEPRETAATRIMRPRYTFLATVVGGRLRRPADEEGNPGNGRLIGCEWLPIDCADFDGGTRDTMARVRASLR